MSAVRLDWRHQPCLTKPSHSTAFAKQSKKITLKKSKKLETVDSRIDPLTLMVLASSRCSGHNSVSSSISALARQPFSGVRTCRSGGACSTVLLLFLQFYELNFTGTSQMPSVLTVHGSPPATLCVARCLCMLPRLYKCTCCKYSAALGHAALAA